MSKAKRYWLQLMTELNVPPVVAKKRWRELELLYRSDGRFYHTLRHVTHFLDCLARLALNGDVSPAMRLAAFYHDAIYDAKRKDNEKRSAQLMVEFGLEAGIARGVISDAEALVLATRKHKVLRGRLSEDSKLFLDCDLMILAASPAVYDKYAANVRLEYSHIKTRDFKAGRADFMEKFLKRKRIYMSDLVHSEFEAAARKNLNRELARLRS